MALSRCAIPKMPSRSTPSAARGWSMPSRAAPDTGFYGSAPMKSAPRCRRCCPIGGNWARATLRRYALSPGSPMAAPSRRSPVPADGHARRHGGSRSADGRRRIRHRRRAGRSVAGHRRGFRRRTSRGRGLGSGILETTASGLEPGRAGAFQPGGKPQGRGSAVCVPGHLHHQALGVGQGPASAARQGIAGICRRAQSRGAAGAADAGAARGRIVRVAEGHGRFERKFFIRCAGPRCRRISSSKMFRRWSAPAWWCGCRRPGA